MSMFDGIKFFCTSTLPDKRRVDLSLLLEHNGARAVPLEEATHVITLSLDYEGQDDAKEGSVTVTDYWIDQSLILGKVQPAQYFSPDPAMLFSGVVGCATDLVPSDIEVLSAGITALGGQWRTGLTRDVTHLFAVSPGSEKYRTALRYQKDTQVKVLVPHWFDDSVRLGIRGLSATTYEWPEPAILTLGKSSPDTDEVGNDLLRPQSKLPRDKRALYKAVLMTAEQETKLGQAETRDIWGSRRILLSPDLELSEGRLNAIEAGITRLGGVVVDCDTQCADAFDVLIARYRWGTLYTEGVNGRKLIGSLIWLFHVQSTGTIGTPTAQLLHYPIPKKPIQGFSAHEITVTNYTGDARDYLRKLITLMGATFTPSMSGKNTVLVAACVSGNKATKARNWSIPVVNHTWLEDCFIQWKNLSVGLEKYVVFPPGLDFSDHLGERGIQREVILETLPDLIAEMALAQGKVSPVEEGSNDDSGDNPSQIAMKRPSASMTNERGDIMEEDVPPPAIESVNIEAASTSAPVTSPSKSVQKSPSNSPSKSRATTSLRMESVLVTPTKTRKAPGGTPQQPARKISPVGAKHKRRASRSESTSGEHPPLLSSLTADTTADQEEVSSRRTSSRSAANRASQRLRDEVMPDVINFEKEMRRGHLRAANLPTELGNEKTVTASKALGKGKKRTTIQAAAESLPASDGEHERKRRRLGSAKGNDRLEGRNDDKRADTTRENKGTTKGGKMKRESSCGDSSEVSVGILTTQITLNENEEKTLVKLGAKIGVKPSECTHLVVKTLARTEKFLCAMAVAPYVVTEKWVRDSIAAKKLLPADKYALADPANEKKWRFKLAGALKRAKAKKGQLFAGKVFYVTNKVPLDKKLLKNIVLAHGGQFRQQNPTVRVLSGKGSDQYYVVSCPEDASVWQPIADAGHPIYSQELILIAALTQEIRLDAEDVRIDTP
ncbi:hypothetical protein BC826DRAFT_649275 [Russula brevipes]|nr:hypothetical protein BC826DRAFT_649275 [Russula brevipes]